MENSQSSWQEKVRLKREAQAQALATVANNQTNCLTEILFEEALARARELDEYRTKHGKVIGPLHGVPITFKDQFDIKGHDTTLGYVGRAFAPATDDAVLVNMLRNLGAVVLAKTNLPQSIMWCETENPLWGLTSNPMCKEYTPGGSTGGEAALLNLRGSMIGWVMKELIRTKPWEHDARCAPVPWRDEVFQEFRSKPLVIGLLTDDGVIRPHPPISRVLLSLVEKLRAAGHEIIEWNADLHAECVQVMDEFYTADGGEDIRRDMLAGGEPFIPHVEALVNRGQPISVYDYWQLNRRKIALQQAYLEKWNKIRSPKTGKPVDVVLMPPMSHAAVPHRSCRWVGYTKIWNVLDYSALIIPAGNICSLDGSVVWNHTPRNVTDEWNAGVWAQNKEKMIELGLPIGVQIAGRKIEEEKVLAVGAVIDELLRGSTHAEPKA
ncbi:hypothetical protein ABKA04_009479 [Annulohypoxylon sp. FPYF3050]